MAYREVRVMDIEQVIRRWTAGEAILAIARTTVWIAIQSSVDSAGGEDRPEGWWRRSDRRTS